MARIARPLYMIATGGYSDFQSLLSSGDLNAMKSMASRSEKWFEDPENHNAPEAEEERVRLHDLKSEIARLEQPVGASA